MDTNTFYAFTSATCFALVGLWWTVVKDRPKWFEDESMRRMSGGVFSSFLIPALMSMCALVGGDVRLIWQLVFVLAAVVGVYFSSRLIKTAKQVNPAGIYGKYGWFVPFLYALVLLFSLIPGLAGLMSLQPLQLEGFLLAGLVLAGHLLAWEFISTPAKS
jgi:hypothetical protein